MYYLYITYKFLYIFINFFLLKNSLYIGSEKSVIRIPASRCGRHSTRVSCLNAQDPMCGWDERRERCTIIPSGSKAHWIQEQLKCPDVEIPRKCLYYT